MVKRGKGVFALLLVSLPAFLAPAQSVPSLINYQGRLTDQAGVPLPIGNYGIQFRLWVSLTASGATDLIWAQQQNTSVQANGVFNVILGAPGGTAIPGTTPAVNDLGFAFTSSNRSLGLTVVSSNGMALSGASEILPRQQLLTVPFAMLSRQVADGAITAQQIAPGAVGSTQIASGGVRSVNLGMGVVTLTNLALRPVGTNVAVGGVAISPLVSTSASAGTAVPGLTVTLITTGRPVMVALSGGSTNARSYINISCPVLYQLAAEVIFLRNGSQVSDQVYDVYGITNPGGYLPPSVFQFIDFPPVGTNTYSIQISNGGFTGCAVNLNNVQLVAFEL